MTSRFVIGLDLAWSARNRTGVAVAIREGSGYRLRDAVALRSDDEILAHIAEAIGDAPCLVTVDAPLRVPNEFGKRECERLLTADYAVRRAGTYPSNRTHFARYGGVRGERIVAALAELGFVFVDGSALGRHAREVVEVYPHPALVNLLSLERTLKYKRKHKRPAEVVANAWTALKAGLRGFAQATPALEGLDALLEEEHPERDGRSRKAYEDRIDAVLCAYIGAHALHWGLRGSRVYGKVEEGAILVPMRPEAGNDARLA